MPCCCDVVRGGWYGGTGEIERVFPMFWMIFLCCSGQLRGQGQLVKLARMEGGAHDVLAARCVVWGSGGNSVKQAW